jgi:hypothetical protein
MNLTFSCATYRSLYLLSSESDLTLLYVLFQLSDKTSPSSQLLPKSYLFECLHPPIFANAFLISKVVSVVYQEGLNVTAVIDLFSTNKRLDQPMNSLLLQINPTPLHRTLSPPSKHHALCLTDLDFMMHENIMSIGSMCFSFVLDFVLDGKVAYVFLICRTCCNIVFTHFSNGFA